MVGMSASCRFYDFPNRLFANSNKLEQKGLIFMYVIVRVNV